MQCLRNLDTSACTGHDVRTVELIGEDGHAGQITMMCAGCRAQNKGQFTLLQQNIRFSGYVGAQRSFTPVSFAEAR